MSPKLYMIVLSPPVRAVQMVAKALGLNLQLIDVNFPKGDNLRPEYLRLNPTGTVPTLVDDDGFVLWESHAILPYLVEKYGKNDSLYPKDIKQRAIIHQQLHFESAVLFPRSSKIVKYIVREGRRTIDQTDRDSVNEAYGYLEIFLRDRPWISGNSPTVADYSLVASVSSADTLIPVDSRKYPKLAAWWRKCERLPGYEAGNKGLERAKAFLKTQLDCSLSL